MKDCLPSGSVLVCLDPDSFFVTIAVTMALVKDKCTVEETRDALMIFKRAGIRSQHILW